MTVRELSRHDLARALSGPGLLIKTGPLIVRLRSRFKSVQAYVASHYGEFPLDEGTGAHFAVDVSPPSLLRQWVRPQAKFSSDGQAPFYPLPPESATALLEWGFNWCVARRVHHLLVVHCAVVSRRGRAVLLPAPPESGKSTLCAALVAHGWRLASDEFALVDPQTALIQPLPRPISLKNASIGIIGSRWHDARFGPEVVNVEGARVRYLQPPKQSVIDSYLPVRARWIVMPRYEAGSSTLMEPASRARMLTHFAESSYNFSQFGRRGFASLTAIVDGSQSFTLTYSNLDEALGVFDRMEHDTGE